MLSNFSKKLTPLLKENKLIDSTNESDIFCLLNFIENKYNIQDYIYPSAVHRELKLQLKLIYSVLECAVETGILEQYLQLYCYHCQKYAGKRYKQVVDIPNSEYCLNCDEEINDPVKYTVVIYRVK